MGLGGKLSIDEKALLIVGLCLVGIVVTIVLGNFIDSTWAKTDLLSTFECILSGFGILFAWVAVIDISIRRVLGLNWLDL